MCNNRNSTKVYIPHQHKWVKVDSCIAGDIESLNGRGIRTLGSCCGHGKYPRTIVAIEERGNYESYSLKQIKRKKRFYVKDKNGLYFIPETLQK